MNSNKVAKHSESSSRADLLGGTRCIRMTGFPLASLRFFISFVMLAHSVAKGQVCWAGHNHFLLQCYFLLYCGNLQRGKSRLKIDHFCPVNVHSHTSIPPQNFQCFISSLCQFMSCPLCLGSLLLIIPLCPDCIFVVFLLTTPLLFQKTKTLPSCPSHLLWGWFEDWKLSFLECLL